MEVFVDFGLFELVGALIMVALSRWIFRRRLVGLVFLTLGAAAPAALVVMLDQGLHRDLAIVALITTTVNATVLAALLLHSPGAIDQAASKLARAALAVMPKVAGYFGLRRALRQPGNKPDGS